MLCLGPTNALMFTKRVTCHCAAKADKKSIDYEYTEYITRAKDKTYTLLTVLPVTVNVVKALIIIF